MSIFRGTSGVLRVSNLGTKRLADVQRRTSARSTTHTKPFDAIPTKKNFLPSSLNLILSGGPKFLHEHCDKLHRQLGPIFRDKLASNEMVFIADTDMIRLVIANEGAHPHHNVPEAWLLYNQTKKIDRGLFFQVGEPWLKLRRAFNKVLLADLSKIHRYSREVLELNDDLLRVWTEQQTNETHSIDIRDVKRALCNWSIEATGLMLFGKRMGCVEVRDRKSSHLERAEELVQSVSDMFRYTAAFQIIPPKLAQNLRLSSWRLFEKASSRMLELANGFAAELIEEVKRTKSNSGLIRDLMDLNCLSDDEISRSMVDLIIAAADTTSNSLQWILYTLAKNPDVQSRVYDEIEEARRYEKTKASDNTARSQYRLAVIREVLRLYPTAPFLARTLDHAITLGDYEIPAGKLIIFSLYTTSRMDKYFDGALDFRPDRWLRSTNNITSSNPKRLDAYATLPFGVGSRMCIGRRLANLEMDLLIRSIVDRFVISLAEPSEKINIELKMILEPSRPIHLRLEPRSN